jgi:rSAM/selenodomain-associated transferase 1
MAKEPKVGETKTRLCPPLTLSQAASLYDAMLRDTINLANGLVEVQLAIAVTPPQATDFFRSISPSGTNLLPIAGADIGDCLHQALSHLLTAGHPQAIALNTDGPTLPHGYLQQAMADLDQADVVLGPSEDGGYYLIGIKQAYPELFQGIQWSTAQVTVETLRRARELGLKVEQLPPWYDVDTSFDLERLRSELVNLPVDALPHTRRFFSQLEVVESSAEPDCTTDL